MLEQGILLLTRFCQEDRVRILQPRRNLQIKFSRPALETAALMLGSDRSRGYCLEMICADFLAGANLDNGDPETLLFSMSRFFRFLPEAQKQAFLRQLGEAACQTCGAMANLEVHHQELRSHSGHDSELNLIRLCAGCNGQTHRTPPGQR